MPGLQYLFSNKKNMDFQRSILILVTPRVLAQVAASDEGSAPMAARMKALQERYGFASNTSANIDAVMAQVQGNDFFREFRQGDVTVERWDRMRTTGNRLKEALEFLYY